MLIREETEQLFKDIEVRIDKLIAEIGIGTGKLEDKDLKWD